jgi:hypothetical protein
LVVGVFALFFTSYKQGTKKAPFPYTFTPCLLLFSSFLSGFLHCHCTFELTIVLSAEASAQKYPKLPPLTTSRLLLLPQRFPSKTDTTATTTHDPHDDPRCY